MKKVRINLFSSTARPEQQIKIPNDLAEALEAEDQAFRQKFGREPRQEDPIFFDPDADQPQFPTEAQQRKTIDAMYHIILLAGIDPAFAYAFRKTGRLLTEENMKFLTPAELAEWNKAIDEHHSMNGPAQ
jgi:hypothetical protein